MNAPLAILGCGAVTPVGLCALQTCTAIRARISGARTILALPPDFEPIIGAQVPARAELRETLESWLVSLATRAVREAVESAPNLDLARVAMFLCVPEADRWRLIAPQVPQFAWLAELERRVGQRFHATSRVLSTGHAAYVEALTRAAKCLAEDRLDACLIAGVDSLVTRPDLDRFAHWHRLRSPEEPQGIVPGEGAACILVAPRRLAHGGPVLAHVRSLGLARETNTVLGTDTSIGTGLLTAVRAAVEDAHIAESAIGLRVSDVNAERYRALEAMLAEARFYRERRSRLPVVFPAQAVGDLGAASGPLLVIVAAHWLAEGLEATTQETFAVCESSSESGLRGACVVASGARLALQPQRKSRAMIEAVVEQHAQEVVFLWQQRELLVRGHHDVTREALAELDERIEAHLAGVDASGERGWNLVSQLSAWQQPGELFLGASSALRANVPQRIHEMIDLALKEPALAPGLVSALAWIEGDQAELFIRALSQDDSVGRRELAITVAMRRGYDLGPMLRQAASAEDLSLRTQAVTALGVLGLVDAAGLVRAALAASEPSLRLAAAESSAWLGLRAGWANVLRSRVEGTHEASDAQLRMLAHGLDHGELKRLHQQLAAAPDSLRLAIRLAAALGETELVPWLIAQCAIPEHARIAWSAVCTITGIDSETRSLTGTVPEDFSAGPDDDAENDDVTLDPDERLPWPEARALERWWRDVPRAAVHDRALAGAPITRDALETLLRGGRQRMRTAAAIELALSTPDEPLHDVGARQRRPFERRSNPVS